MAQYNGSAPSNVTPIAGSLRSSSKDNTLHGIATVINAAASVLREVPFVGPLGQAVLNIVKICENCKCNKDAFKKLRARVASMAFMLFDTTGGVLAAIAQQRSIALAENALVIDAAERLHSALVNGADYLVMYTKRGFIASILYGDNPKDVFKSFDREVATSFNQLNTAVGLQHSLDMKITYDAVSEMGGQLTCQLSNISELKKILEDREALEKLGTQLDLKDMNELVIELYNQVLQMSESLRQVHEAKPWMSSSVVDDIKRKLSEEKITETERVVDFFSLREMPEILRQEEILGDGCFGTVYRGRYEGRNVAIKVLRNDIFPDGFTSNSSFGNGSGCGSSGSISSSFGGSYLGSNDCDSESDRTWDRFALYDDDKKDDTNREGKSWNNRNNRGFSWKRANTDSAFENNNSRHHHNSSNFNYNSNRNKVSVLQKKFEREIQKCDALRKEVRLHMHAGLYSDGVVKILGVALEPGSSLYSEEPLIVMERALLSLEMAMYKHAGRLDSSRIEGLDRTIYLTLSTKLVILKQIALALEFLDRVDMVHRDVTPANILLFHEGGGGGVIKAKLCDFALSQIQTNQSSHSKLRGTRPYAAPEILSMVRKYSSASDVYSFAVTINETLAEVEPFPGVMEIGAIDLLVAQGMRPLLFPWGPLPPPLSSPSASTRHSPDTQSISGSGAHNICQDVESDMGGDGDRDGDTDRGSRIEGNLRSAAARKGYDQFMSSVTEKAQQQQQQQQQQQRQQWEHEGQQKKEEDQQREQEKERRKAKRILTGDTHAERRLGYALESLVQRCWQTDPRQRPPISYVSIELSRLLQELACDTPPIPPSSSTSSTALTESLSAPISSSSLTPDTALSTTGSSDAPFSHTVTELIARAERERYHNDNNNKNTYANVEKVVPREGHNSKSKATFGHDLGQVLGENDEWGAHISTVFPRGSSSSSNSSSIRNSSNNNPLIGDHESLRGGRVKAGRKRTTPQRRTFSIQEDISIDDCENIHYAETEMVETDVTETEAEAETERESSYYNLDGTHRKQQGRKYPHKRNKARNLVHLSDMELSILLRFHDFDADAARFIENGVSGRTLAVCEDVADLSHKPFSVFPPGYAAQLLEKITEWKGHSFSDAEWSEMESVVRAK